MMYGFVCFGGRARACGSAAAVVALVAGVGVGVAAPVRFENTTGQGFGQMPLFGPVEPQHVLDVTRSAEAQTGEIAGSSTFIGTSEIGSGQAEWLRMIEPVGAGAGVVLRGFDQAGERGNAVIAALAAGAEIGPAQTFGGGCAPVSRSVDCVRSQPIVSLIGYNFPDEGIPDGSIRELATAFGDGEVAHVGVRFPLEDGDHFGYIEVRRNSGGAALAVGDDGTGTAAWLNYDVLAWGYETTANTAIAAGAAGATCPADFNGDTTPGDIFDLFDFLAALDGGLDFNGDTSPADIFDLFDFLAVLDAGCP